MINSLLNCKKEELNENMNNKDFLKSVTGAFSIYEGNKAVRDHLGIAPLYYSEKDNRLYFSYNRSELFKFTSVVKDFPPGYYYDNGFHKFYEVKLQNNSYDPKEFRQKLSYTLKNIIYKTPIVLLSGGIDSAAVLSEAYNIDKKTTALTVGMKDSEDIKSSKECCERIGAKHIIVEITIEDILKVIPEVVKNIESWNYSLVRNSIPTYIAMKKAKENGFNFVLTGDCADGVLAGQEHLKNYRNEEEKIFLEEYKDMYRTEIRRMQNQARALDIEAWSPFIYYPFTEYIMSIPFNQKYKNENGKIINKIPIRDAYRKIVPNANRIKTPISSGAGMDFLTSYFNNLIKNEEFEMLKKEFYPIKFLSKEHVYYFKIWKDIFFKNGTEYENYWKYGSYGSWDFYYK